MSILDLTGFNLPESTQFFGVTGNFLTNIEDDMRYGVILNNDSYEIPDERLMVKKFDDKLFVVPRDMKDLDSLDSKEMLLMSTGWKNDLKVYEARDNDFRFFAITAKEMVKKLVPGDYNLGFFSSISIIKEGHEYVYSNNSNINGWHADVKLGTLDTSTSVIIKDSSYIALDIDFGSHKNDIHVNTFFPGSWLDSCLPSAGLNLMASIEEQALLAIQNNTTPEI